MKEIKPTGLVGNTKMFYPDYYAYRQKLPDY